MKPKSLILVALAVGGNVFAAPPLEIKGVKNGATVEQANKALPGFACNQDECLLVPSLYVDKECRDAGDRISCKEWTESELEFGPAKVVKMYMGDVANGRVGRMVVVFDQFWFAGVVSALRTKYGAPTGSSTQMMSNALGAKFRNRVFVWSRPEGELRAEERPETVDTSHITMTASWYAAAARSKAAHKAIKDASKL